MGGGDVVTPVAEHVPDSTVLHRAVLDHTQLCEVCSRAAGPCVYLARLKAMTLAAGEGEQVAR